MGRLHRKALAGNISGLILKHLGGETNPEEEAELQKWISEDEENRLFIESLDDEEAYLDELEFFSSVDDAAAWENIAKQTFQSTEIPSKANRSN